MTGPHAGLSWGIKPGQEDLVTFFYNLILPRYNQFQKRFRAGIREDLQERQAKKTPIKGE